LDPVQIFIHVCIWDGQDDNMLIKYWYIHDIGLPKKPVGLAKKPVGLAKKPVGLPWIDMIACGHHLSF
jgi:hypothetical protein